MTEPVSSAVQVPRLALGAGQAAYDALVEQGFALASERERTVDPARSAYEAAISPRR